MRKKDVQRVNSLKNYLKYFGIAFIVYICASNITGFIIATVFDTVSRNFNYQTLISNNIRRGIEFILFGSLYLAYLYSKENAAYRVEMNDYEKVLASSKIQQLKAQLNPHFLFNNLNTLDQLIEEDKDKASNFLHHFSELYRYSLITSEKKLVSLKEEIRSDFGCGKHSCHINDTHEETIQIARTYFNDNSIHRANKSNFIHYVKFQSQFEGEVQLNIFGSAVMM